MTAARGLARLNAALSQRACLATAASLVLGCLVPVAISGCGHTCDRITAIHAAMLGDAAKDRVRSGQADLPHAEIIIPHALANALLAEIVAAENQQLTVRLPSLGSLGEAIPELAATTWFPELSVTARGVRLVPAPAGRAGLAVDVELTGPDGVLATAELTVDSAPVLERQPASERAELRIGIEADSLRGIVPRLGPGGARAVATLVHGKLPATVRQRVSLAALQPVIERGLTRILTESYDLIRTHVLDRLGELTRLRIGLPSLPIARVDVRTRARPGALVLGLYFQLGAGQDAGHGLVERGEIDPAMLGRIEFRLTGQAMTGSANWGIAHGLLPARYDRQLEPDRNGAYVPVFGWRGGSPRPLELHVFRLSSPCACIFLTAHAELAVRGNELEVLVTDRHVERVEGSSAVKLGVWLDALWRQNFRASKKHAAETVLTIGTRHLVTRVGTAELQGDELRFGLDVTVAP